MMLLFYFFSVLILNHFDEVLSDLGEKEIWTINLRLTKQDAPLSTLNETNTKAKQRLLNQVGRKCRMKFEKAALIPTLVFVLCFMYFKTICQIIRLTVHCNLELFIDSHKQQFWVLWATAVLSCEQKLFSLKKWHFEKPLHFSSKDLQKKVLNQDSLLEEKHLYTFL